MKKRGISTVIATLLLVVITIVAIIIIWQFVKRNIIEENIEESSCYDYRDYIRILDSEYTCSNNTNTLIQIERGFDDKDIEGISLSISKGATARNYELKNGTTVEGVKMYDGSNIIILPKKGEALTYIFNIEGGNYATITVIINGRICDNIRQSYKINPCL